jgi:hypothetical protein
MSKQSDTNRVSVANYKGIEKHQSIVEYVVGMAYEGLCCGIGSEVGFYA